MEPRRSFSTTFLDSERTLAFILGVHAGYLSRGVLLTTEEVDKKNWIQSDLFSGGVESSAILKERLMLFRFTIQGLCTRLLGFTGQDRKLLKVLKI